MIWELIIVAILLGIYPIIIKFALNHISPPTFMLGFGICYFIFEIIYSTIHYKILKKDFSTLMNKKFIFGIFILSGFIVSSINFLHYDLIKKYKVYYITSILSIYPVITALISYLFLKEYISLYAFIGVILIVCGIIIINLSELLNTT